MSGCNKYDYCPNVFNLWSLSRQRQSHCCCNCPSHFPIYSEFSIYRFCFTDVTGKMIHRQNFSQDKMYCKLLNIFFKNLFPKQNKILFGFGFLEFMIRASRIEDLKKILFVSWWSVGLQPCSKSVFIVVELFAPTQPGFEFRVFPSRSICLLIKQEITTCSIIYLVRRKRWIHAFLKDIHTK